MRILRENFGGVTPILGVVIVVSDDWGRGVATPAISPLDPLLGFTKINVQVKCWTMLAGGDLQNVHYEASKHWGFIY